MIGSESRPLGKAHRILDGDGRPKRAKGGAGAKSSLGKSMTASHTHPEQGYMGLFVQKKREKEVFWP